MEDFYDNLKRFKKEFKVNNEALGVVLGKRGDAVRKSISRQSLSDLEIQVLKNFIKTKNTEHKDFGYYVDQIFEFTNEDKKDYKIDKEFCPVPEDNYMIVQYADLSSSAGSLGVMPIEQIPETKRRLIPREYSKGNYLVVRVDGISMDDNSSRAICDGDEILVKEYILNNGDTLPFRNHLFVLSSREGDVVKQIIKHDTENGIIICRSFNKHWEDYPIKLEDVFSIFTVEKIVNRKLKF